MSLTNIVLMNSIVSIRKIIYFLKQEELLAKMKTSSMRRQKGTCPSFFQLYPVR